MNRIWYSLLTAAALSVLERVHRRTHQGLMVDPKELTQVKIARNLLRILEDT